MLNRDCGSLDMIWCNKCVPLFISADKADDELEMTMVCHRPEGLDQLEAQTNFTKQELQILYRGFKNVITHFLILLLDYLGMHVLRIL